MKIVILMFGFISNDGVSSILEVTENPNLDDVIACTMKVDQNHFCEVSEIDISDLSSLEIVVPKSW